MSVETSDLQFNRRDLKVLSENHVKHISRNVTST
jgi:hypothetical protein